MVRGLTTLGLCLGLSASALAESGVPNVQDSVPTAIPSDGVLPLTGSCVDLSCSNLTSAIIVHTASGTRVEGQFELRYTAGEGWAYFVPSVPFRSGDTYAVTLRGGSTRTTSVVSVSDPEPAGLDESALGVTAALTKVRTVTDSECCPMSVLTRSPRCLDVSVLQSVALVTTLSAERPVATQYLYELTMHAPGEAAGAPVLGFGPLRSNAPGGPPKMTFDGAADSYCYMVRARPIVGGGDPVTLMARCIANDITGLGRQVRAPEEVAQWRSTCEDTPTTVDAGTLPRDQADAATDADGEPLGPSKDGTIGRDHSGCQLAGDAPQAGSMMWWPLVLLALARAQARFLSRPRG